MLSFRIRAAVAALLCLLASTPLRAQQPGLPRPVAGDGFGVNIHFTQFAPDELRLFKEAGFGYVRMDLNWQSVEKAAGVYDFSAYDKLLADLDQAGARALLILDYENPLYDNGLSPHTDAGRAAFAAFAVAAARRYSGRGVIFEIWNEPNIGFWKPKPDVNDYAALVKATVKAIRQVDPAVPILAGATSTLPQDYLEKLFASGAMNGVTALSVHPYRSGNPETVADDYARVRGLIARYTQAGQPLLPIVCSEWGYSTASSHVSENVQAAYMLREYLVNLASGVNMTTYYDWKDDGSDPRNAEHRYGILRQSLAPKPAYVAARNLLQRLRACTFCHRLASADPDQYDLLFEGPDGLAVVSWNSGDSADPARQMPSVRKVGPADPDYALLRHAAAIRFTPDVRIATCCPTVPVKIMVRNPEDAPARVELTNLERRRVLVIPPHESRMAYTSLFIDPDNPQLQPIDLKCVWNGQPVSVIAPLQAQAESLLDVEASPTADGLTVSVYNPLAVRLDGKLSWSATAAARPAEAMLAVAAGARTSVVLPGASTLPQRIVISDAAGLVWARARTPVFAADPDWPAMKPQAGFYRRLLFVDNRPMTPTPVNAAPCASGAPGPSALVIPYDTGSGRRYFTVSPVAADPIPDNAKAVTLWIYGDKTGAQLRCRYTDSGGQTFQPNGIAIDWQGWRPVTFALDGTSATWWGGAADGAPHPPLRWDAFVLIDGSNMPAQTGLALVAAPSYSVK